LSFINPLFLIAAAGALIPVIIHLTRKQRARKMPFSSLLFLKASPKELIRKRRLRDLILLLIRAAIIALLAFAFARPYFPRDKIQLNITEEDKSIVIFIDNSYSISYASSFDRIKKEAKNIIDNAGRRDEISITVFSDHAQQLTPFTSDKNILINTLDQNVKLSYRTTDYYNSLQLAEEILNNANNPRHIVMMISDFQDNGFGSHFQQWKLDPGITFVPVNIAPENIDNSYINSFNLRQSKTNKAKATEFKAEISQNGKITGRENTCDLYINNSNISGQKINPEQTNQAFFQQFNLKRGNFQGYLKTNDDNLNIDNIHYFTYEVTDLPRILCIDGRLGNRQSDNFFLRSAFSFGDESIFRFTSNRTTYIAKNNLKKYDMVFLANINTLSGNRLTSIMEYVSEGGNIIISFGDNINVGSAARIMQKFGVGKIMNPDDIKNTTARNTIITDINFRHPVFSLFGESGAGELYRPKFRRYIEIEPDSNAVVLGSFDSGYPFLIEKKSGKGKIFIYTSTFNTSWTDFPVHDIYVPFLYQLANYILIDKQRKNSYLIGETIALNGNPDELWKINTPDNNKFDIKADETGLGRFVQTDIPGNYKAVAKTKTFYFSVNVDIRESDLKFRNPEETFAIVSRKRENANAVIAGTGTGDKTDEENEQKIWKYILLILIVMFAFETFYAHNNIKIEKKS